MSGGHFDYYQHHINEIAEHLEKDIADVEYGKSIGKVKKSELCGHLVDVNSENNRRFWPMWLMEMCCQFKTKKELIDNLKKWYVCYEKDGKFFIDNAEGPGVFEVVVDNQEYEEFADGKWHYEIDDPEVLEEFKKGLKILKMAAIYAQRIDWLLSCDDGEDSFKRRLKEELDELESKPLVDYERWFETLKDDADDE
jgi:hypothetical protein